MVSMMGLSMTKAERDDLFKDITRLPNLRMLRPINHIKGGMRHRIVGKLRYGSIDSLEIIDIIKIMHRKDYNFAFTIKDNGIEFW